MRHARILATVAVIMIAAYVSTSASETGAAGRDLSWMFGPFIKQDDMNPIMKPLAGSVFRCPIRKQNVAWEEKDVFNPAAVVKDGKVYLLYRAQDKIGKPEGTSRIGLAVSDDGLHFTRLPEPVLYPDEDFMKKYEWEGGCEDPRVAESEDGTYIMTYTSYDGRIARLSVASSKDLTHWTKHGLAFSKDAGGKLDNIWSKSGAIVTEFKEGRFIAKKINGKYWMYFGDSDIFVATSDNLIDWTPVKAAKPRQSYFSFKQPQVVGGLQRLISVRSGNFDSNLVESGPQAVFTDDGIVFIYNSENSNFSGLPQGTYAAGQLLIDPNDPAKVISRTDNYFIAPDKPYEITGQVNNVVFIEGMVWLKGKYFLYYGTADSRIAVAVWQP
jgi:beta-1,2-mannosidase